jgi:hypothetical protein
MKQKWEYLVYKHEPDPDFPVEFTLRDLGRDGWELVAVTDLVYYFKRILEEAAS